MKCVVLLRVNFRFGVFSESIHGPSGWKSRDNIMRQHFDISSTRSEHACVATNSKDETSTTDRQQNAAHIPSPPIDVDLPTNLIGDRDHVLVMRFSVLYRRRSGNRKRLRVGRHVMPNDIESRQFRLNLVGEYNRTNKQVLKIEQHEGGWKECMDICEKVELLKQLKDECVEAIKSREPDSATPDEGIDSDTVVWVAGFVETWFDDKIFDAESA